MEQFTKEDIAAMREALRQASLAAAEGETPIGAVLTVGGEIIAAEHNHREGSLDIASHAEIEALRAAARARGDWRMADATLYVTLEPCPMCAGAILAARVGRVVYGAYDPVAGAMGSVLHLPRFPLGAHPTVEAGLLSEECRDLLVEFFKSRR